MTFSEKARQKLDIAGKEMKEALEPLKREVEELSLKVKEKLKGAGDEMKETAQELTREVKTLTEKVSNLFPLKRKDHQIKVHVNETNSLYEHDRRPYPFAGTPQMARRMFDDFSEGFGVSPYERQHLWGLETSPFDWPYVDIREDEKEIHIIAELPGVNKRNVDVSISENRIIIRGEKKEHKEETKSNYYRIERSCGSFNRSFVLPCQVQRENATASYKDGVLHVRLPKTAEACKRSKRIKVRAA